MAAELVRLVSCVESMKPVLQSLYHRILLYPPPQHRTEAIRIMKEVGADPNHQPYIMGCKAVTVVWCVLDSGESSAAL